MDVKEPRGRGLRLRLGSGWCLGLALGEGGCKGERASDAAFGGLRTDLGDGRPATRCLVGFGRWRPASGLENRSRFGS